MKDQTRARLQDQIATFTKIAARSKNVLQHSKSTINICSQITSDRTRFPSKSRKYIHQVPFSSAFLNFSTLKQTAISFARRRNKNFVAKSCTKCLFYRCPLISPTPMKKAKLEQNFEQRVPAIRLLND